MIPRQQVRRALIACSDVLSNSNIKKRKHIFMEIKEHLYFKSQKITISGVLNYIIRSNSLYTYITSNSFSKPNTGDPLKKKKMAGESGGDRER